METGPFAGVQERGSSERGGPHNFSESIGLDELEQLLKQMTFTRTEIDRSTELLRSLTVDSSSADENRKITPNTSEPAANSDVPLQENGANVQRNGWPGCILTPPVHSSVAVPAEISSAAEIAMAYMGTSRVSPATLGLQSQAFRDDASFQHNAPYAPKSPNSELAPRSGIRFSSVPRLSEDASLSPKFQGGRSGIHNMVRSPYSRPVQAISSPATGFSFGESTTAVSTSSLATGFSFGGSSAAASTSSPATGFSFGGSSTAGSVSFGAPSTAGNVSFGGSSAGGFAFGSSLGASSGPAFSFTSAASAATQGPLTAPASFGTASPGNDQMDIEDSMAEDTVQAPTPAAPFGMAASSPSPLNFVFGSSSVPAGGSLPFQFGAPQNPGAPQAPSPFTPGSSLAFNRGSFSLESVGGDKANRRIVKMKRDKGRRLAFNRGRFSLGSGGGDKANRRIVKIKQDKGRRLAFNVCLTRKSLRLWMEF